MELWKSNNCRTLISLMIEFVQVVFAGRIGDIDDIIFNTLGFLIGYILENLLQKILLKKAIRIWNRGIGTGYDQWISKYPIL